MCTKPHVRHRGCELPSRRRSLPESSRTSSLRPDGLEPRAWDSDTMLKNGQGAETWLQTIESLNLETPNLQDGIRPHELKPLHVDVPLCATETQRLPLRFGNPRVSIADPNHHLGSSGSAHQDFFTARGARQRLGDGRFLVLLVECASAYNDPPRELALPIPQPRGMSYIPT
jgi:hypothetical protein